MARGWFDRRRPAGAPPDRGRRVAPVAFGAPRRRVPAATASTSPPSRTASSWTSSRPGTPPGGSTSTRASSAWTRGRRPSRPGRACRCPPLACDRMTPVVSHLTIDAADPHALARWWRDVLGLVLTSGSPGRGRRRDRHRTPPTAPRPGGCSSRSPTPRSPRTACTPTCVLPTAPTSPRSSTASSSLGATRVDIGQGDVPWHVLADPEGNEFCLLRSTPPTRWPQPSPSRRPTPDRSPAAGSSSGPEPPCHRPPTSPRCCRAGPTSRCPPPSAEHSAQRLERTNVDSFFPSAEAPARADASFMTAPMSRTELAPTSAITDVTSACSSSSDSCAGRYVSMRSASAVSVAARCRHPRVRVDLRRVPTLLDLTRQDLEHVVLRQLLLDRARLRLEAHRPDDLAQDARALRVAGLHGGGQVGRQLVEGAHGSHRALGATYPAQSECADGARQPESR